MDTELKGLIESLGAGGIGFYIAWLFYGHLKKQIQQEREDHLEQLKACAFEKAELRAQLEEWEKFFRDSLKAKE